MLLFQQLAESEVGKYSIHVRLGTLAILISAVVSAVFWYAQTFFSGDNRIMNVEKQTIENTTKIQNLEVKVDTHRDDDAKQFSAIRESLARIEGALGINKR